ncbi:hypothetical protein ARMGADRAFT_340228 [Armillaria gallica]|uniref:Uncharacterized protein n=1 Tax=Armillaria gallica TaxID=47427 RepID=A0A2H3DM47_ARMGA|nr:hypothetical protein ARMGADRAFT_340228 [Armillaria gallica]
MFSVFFIMSLICLFRDNSITRGRQGCYSTDRFLHICQAYSYRALKVYSFLKITCILITGVRFCTPASRATSSTRWAIALNCRFMSAAPTCKAGTETVVKKRIPGWPSVTILVLSTTEFEGSGSAGRF